MKAWMTAALLFTFLSGSTTGYLLGRPAAPAPREQTRVDAYLRELQKQGVSSQDDLTRAREILEERDRNLMALKSKVELLLKDQIDSINLEAQQQIEGIMAGYENGPTEPR